jgi:L-fuculose-phosphate aldolase
VLDRRYIDNLKNEIIKIGKDSSSFRYVTTVGGNISTKIDDSTYLITGTEISLNELDLYNIVIINEKGELVEGGIKPSKEAGLHLEIYKKRKDVKAIVHLHPIIATTLATINEPISPVCGEQIFFLGTKIGSVPYLQAGGKDLKMSVAEELVDCNVVILKNHGSVSVGSNLKEAYYRTVKLEMAAFATVIAKLFDKTIEPFQLL